MQSSHPEAPDYWPHLTWPNMTPPAKQDNRALSRAATSSETPVLPVKRSPKTAQLKTVVTVNVGPEDTQATFSPHRELLCLYSPYFRTMLNGNWEEAKSNTINLRADDPQVFEIFQNWLYGVNLELDSDQTKDISLLLSLWIFGDKIQVAEFQNAAIEGLRYATVERPRIFRLKDIETAFENSGEGSPIRKLIVDLYVWEGPVHGQMKKFLEEGYPQAFIAQVFEGYVDTFPRPGWQTVRNKRPYGANAMPYYIRFPGTSVGPDGAMETTET